MGDVRGYTADSRGDSGVGEQQRGHPPLRGSGPARPRRRPSLVVAELRGGQREVTRLRQTGGIPACLPRGHDKDAAMRLEHHTASRPAAPRPMGVARSSPLRLHRQAARLLPGRPLHVEGFRRRRPDGTGDWKWRLADTRRVLYQLPVYSRPWSAARTSWSWRVRRMSTRSSRLARWPPATRWEPAFGLRRAPARWQGHRRRRPRRCGPGPRVRGGEVVRGRSGRGRPGGAEQGGALIGGDPSGDLDAVHGDVQPPFYSGNGFDTLGPPDRRPHGRAFARPEGAVFIGV